MEYIKDLNALTNLEKIKDYIYMECHPTDDPIIIEKNLPFIQCGDIAITYNICLEAEENLLKSALITKELLGEYGITIEELHQYVAQTTSSILKPVCEPIDDSPFLHVTNSSNVSGASVMFYYDFLPDLSEELGQNLFVIPVSINDILVCPDDGIFDPSVLEYSLQHCNDVHGSEYFLSDHIYYYDYNKHCLAQIVCESEENTSFLS